MRRLYDTIAYRRRKEAERLRVARGGVRCGRGAKCHRAELVAGEWIGGPIDPLEPWDLGHDEHGNIRGPEHRRCNRTTYSYQLAKSNAPTSEIW